MCVLSRRRGLSTLTVMLPVFPLSLGSTAHVYVPTMGAKDAVVAEGGVAVWSKGSYVPGVAGITGASLEGSAVVIATGSGSYAFTVSSAE